ncbi:hypothetical protein VOLCADRAFT_105384 [Volvox carteri f. nagariensis]|uniref:Uncharacterized protein n=1 Tax=Volvox carteri f. nagariensis TaxID=3068 RepID=D8U0H2_VOLCA|nr:uncharacterized protein VOLCADRAFT_105384 [Volvox carteri f. nagariensis]EFJ46721.1 hypothetical protein VOLCADRAFT_105384 [Volvox carteri f. nagariensis]|eukprot:XP_002952250.1 hypothetical protein VOLCADRAFT_105384 [Volvox carteri f. nagariensis]
MKYLSYVGAALVFTAVLACTRVFASGRALTTLQNLKHKINNRIEDEPVAVWHEQFSVQFSETTSIFVTKHTVGTWYYDAVAQKEAVYRQNGNGDRYCGSIHPFTQTPCVHIVSGGKRYLVFPQLGECCMCCTAEKGCGLLSPNWLQDASFEGISEIQDVPAYKWRKDGLQPNYWYATADPEQIPLELDQMPNDLMTFWPDSFLAEAPPAGVFELPNNCRPRRVPLVFWGGVSLHQRVHRRERAAGGGEGGGGGCYRCLELGKVGGGGKGWWGLAVCLDLTLGPVRVRVAEGQLWAALELAAGTPAI